MPEGLLIQPEHLRRLNAMLAWWERNQRPIETQLRRRNQPAGYLLPAPAETPASGQARWIAFTLQEDTQSFAPATVVAFWDGTDPDPESEGVDVYLTYLEDINGFTGQSGLACYDSELDRYFAVRLDRRARFIRFQLDEALSIFDATAAAQVLTFWDGTDPDPETEGITVANCAGVTNYQFSGQQYDIGIATRDDSGNYRILQLVDTT